MDIERIQKKRKHDCVRSIMESWSSTKIAAAYYFKYMYKEPCMTSPQTGEAWMNEVLNGHHIRSVNAFRMHSHVFLKLCG